MSRLRTLIVDDESLARRGMALRLADLPDIDLVGQCDGGLAALDAVAEHKPDLLLLDIQMPDLNGFEVAKRLPDGGLPLVIFVTAFDAYAIEAFKVHAVDYLLKPVDPERLREAVARASQRLREQAATQERQKLLELLLRLSPGGPSPSSSTDYPERLAVRDADGVEFVSVAEIDWIDAAGDYMCLHVSGKTHIMRVTLKHLVATLDPARFLRVHRSTLVNVERIRGLRTADSGDLVLRLDQDAEVKVGRSYREVVVQHLGL
jgi:two-component system, LytTR family, response regulator